MDLYKKQNMCSDCGRDSGTYKRCYKCNMNRRGGSISTSSALTTCKVCRIKKHDSKYPRCFTCSKLKNSQPAPMFTAKPCRSCNARERCPCSKFCTEECMSEYQEVLESSLAIQRKFITRYDSSSSDSE